MQLFKPVPAGYMNGMGQGVRLQDYMPVTGQSLGEPAVRDRDLGQPAFRGNRSHRRNMLSLRKAAEPLRLPQIYALRCDVTP